MCPVPQVFGQCLECEIDVPLLGALLCIVYFVCCVGWWFAWVVYNIGVTFMLLVVIPYGCYKKAKHVLHVWRQPKHLPPPAPKATPATPLSSPVTFPVKED